MAIKVLNLFRAIMTYFEGKDLEIIESVKIKQDAVPAYEMLKDCLVWTDERLTPHRHK